MGTVEVIGRRVRLDPPEPGRCEDPECLTVAAGDTGYLLLVALYTVTADGITTWRRLCAACDDRRLREWIAADG